MEYIRPFARLLARSISKLASIIATGARPNNKRRNAENRGDTLFFEEYPALLLAITLLCRRLNKLGICKAQGTERNIIYHVKR